MGQNRRYTSIPIQIVDATIPPQKSQSKPSMPIVELTKENETLKLFEIF